VSRGDRFDRAGFESRYARASTPPAVEPERTWPIAAEDLVRIGQSILGDRDGTGRPHKGIDLFAAAGTPVRAAIAGRVLRVVDGRRSGGSSRRQAGLFVDVLGADDKVYRYLHLGTAQVAAGQAVASAEGIGTVAAAGTSGLGAVPHLHFEIADSDYDAQRGDYGPRRDPLRHLPPLRT
jgi:murein DD-endopeptidase MepM/ murein hydrolase activator NlpD